jgi:uncharacterized membrane protein
LLRQQGWRLQGKPAEKLKGDDMKGQSFRRVIRAALVGGMLLVASGAAAFSLGKFERVKAASGAVTIPTAKIADGKAHFFKLADGGKEIAFFVVKGSDGTVKSAFDACDACYREKQGYEQQREKMNCKNCNKKFVINRIGPNTSGGCNPAYLPHRQADGAIVFNLADLQAGARFF